MIHSDGQIRVVHARSELWVTDPWVVKREPLSPVRNRPTIRRAIKSFFTLLSGHCFPTSHASGGRP